MRLHLQNKDNDKDKDQMGSIRISHFLSGDSAVQGFRFLPLLCSQHLVSGSYLVHTTATYFWQDAIIVLIRSIIIANLKAPTRSDRKPRAGLLQLLHQSNPLRFLLTSLQKSLPQTCSQVDFHDSASHLQMVSQTIQLRITSSFALYEEPLELDWNMGRSHSGKVVYDCSCRLIKYRPQFAVDDLVGGRRGLFLVTLHSALNMHVSLSQEGFSCGHRSFVKHT